MRLDGGAEDVLALPRTYRPRVGDRVAFAVAIGKRSRAARDIELLERAPPPKQADPRNRPVLKLERTATAPGMQHELLRKPVNRPNDNSVGFEPERARFFTNSDRDQLLRERAAALAETERRRQIDE